MVAAAALLGFFMVTLDAVMRMAGIPCCRCRCSGPGRSASRWTGFAFMVGYYGLPFVMSLCLQQLRGLSALDTGIVFLPMMLTGAVLTPFIARLTGRFGARALIITGLAAMTAGLVVMAVAPSPAPVAALSALMILTGLAGPLVMPPVMALLLQAVPARRAGAASGVFNTSRQAGGALAVAVFGALLASRATLVHGLRVSLLKTPLTPAEERTQP